jgi:enamine deaminase RidA (YjgF/YER057c/UK114 family)
LNRPAPTRDLFPGDASGTPRPRDAGAVQSTAMPALALASSSMPASPALASGLAPTFEPARAPSLSVSRLDLAAWQAMAGQARCTPLLGGLAYGTEPGSGDAVRAQVLCGDAPRVDAWQGSGRLTEGRSGQVAWRHDGHWLFGAVELDECRGAGLESLAREAYGDVFASLRDTGCPHLLRLWNYLPRINADDGGMERYRQFNAGRQHAFLAARQAAFEGAPAACAIGTRSGPFCVRFLAGRTPPVPLENPRQVSAYRYPVQYGLRAPTFSRAALVQAAEDTEALFISGTASIVGHETRHVGDVRAQTRETLANLQALLAEAGTRCNARFTLGELEGVVYVRRPEDAASIRQLLDEAVGAGSSLARTAVMLEADICRGELLVEIEAHGFARGRVQQR